jgi:hypothetical protein
VTNPDYRDPSLDYPPSRPTVKMLLIALAVVAVVIVIASWPRVSAFAHIAQIESEIEHVVGL